MIYYAVLEREDRGAGLARVPASCTESIAQCELGSVSRRIQEGWFSQAARKTDDSAIVSDCCVA